MASSQPDVLETVRRIAKNLHERKVVLFIAAGCSADSDIPLGAALAMKMALSFYHTQTHVIEKFGTQQLKLDEVAQIVCNEQGKPWVVRELEFESWRDKRPNESHKVIGELAREGMLQNVVTVNYDELIENGCRLVDHEPIVIRSDHDLGLVQHGKLTIYKINGCVTRPADIRITTDDLKANYEGWVRDQMKTLLRTNGMTFIGMSNPSPILLDMFKDVFGKMPEVRLKPFWVNRGENPETAAQELLSICEANQNYIPMSSNDFLRQLQISAIRIVIEAIFNNTVDDQIKNICQQAKPEVLEQLNAMRRRVQSFFLSRDMSQLSDMLKLSRIEFGDPYMQFEGYEMKIARLFLWITLINWALERLFPEPLSVNLDTNGVHLSLTDSGERRLSFVFVDSIDDPISSRQILSGWLDMLSSHRSSLIGPDPEFLKRPHKLIILRMGAGDSKKEFQIVISGETYRPLVFGDTNLLDELSNSGPDFLVDRLKDLLKE